MTLPLTTSTTRRIHLYDRREAGAALGDALAQYANRSDVIVLGLPRGGVPVAAAVADALDAPLDVFVVRKLGVPGHEELAFGALASGGTVALNSGLIRELGLSQASIRRVERAEQQELDRRERLYRDDRPFPDLHKKTVIVVDDGLATGATMYAAVNALRQLEAARIIVAVPVGSQEAMDTLRSVADDVVALATPDPFMAVGVWYEHFGQTSDEEVHALLAGRAP